MNPFQLLLLLLLLTATPAFPAGEAATPFDTYGGYFVSNKFEPDAATSFVIIQDQEQFDRVFGAAFVMQDKSHRLAPDAFKTHTILAVIHRGHAMWEYQVAKVSLRGGIAELHFTGTSQKKSDDAEFACPLIVSIPKGNYPAVKFVENGKVEIVLKPAK